MINWQNGVTPINETNMNKLIQEDDNPLLYKGNVPVSDLNDLTTSGIYYTSNLNLANAPDRYQYHYVEVIGFSGAKLQRLVNPDQHYIATREYSGSPATWTSWQYQTAERYNGTLASEQSIYFSLEPLKNYLLTVTNYGQGNVGTECQVYIVSTGQDNQHTSKAFKISGSSASIANVSVSRISY